MKRKNPTIRNYVQAAAYLGSKWHRPLHGRSTSLERLNDSTIAVKYHYTNVVEYSSNGLITIRTNGYETVTTKRKINEYAPVRIWQHNYVWYANGERFSSPMTIDSSIPRETVYCPMHDSNGRFVDHCVLQPSDFDYWGNYDPDNLQPKRLHWIGMAGMRGYLPNYCEVFASEESAIDSLLDLHDLSDRSKYARELRQYGYTDLILHKHGNEYCEVTSCDCDDPATHSDSPNDLDWLAD